MTSFWYPYRRASRSELFSKKDVLQNFIYSQFHNFTHVKSLFNKPECMLFYYKETLQHRCFPVNIAKFLRTPILKNIYKRLIQQISKFTLFWYLYYCFIWTFDCQLLSSLKLHIKICLICLKDKILFKRLDSGRISIL